MFAGMWTISWPNQLPPGVSLSRGEENMRDIEKRTTDGNLKIGESIRQQDSKRQQWRWEEHHELPCPGWPSNRPPPCSPASKQWIKEGWMPAGNGRGTSTNSLTKGSFLCSKTDKCPREYTRGERDMVERERESQQRREETALKITPFDVRSGCYLTYKI